MYGGKIKSTFLALNLVFLLSLQGTGQELWHIQKLKGTIDFDGLPFEKAWENIKPFPMVMQQPNYGNQPSEKTEIRLTYDDRYIYVSGRMYDREPSKIQATTKKRDEFTTNSDGFGILFDNFNDKQNALAFSTTPSGNRTDFTIFNDAHGRPDRMPFNMSWNTFWDVKTVRDDRGWFAEIRIPLSSLRFQTINNETIMGITVWRWLPHKNEVSSSPGIDPKYGSFAMMKPSLARGVVFEGLKNRKPLYIAPYVLGGITQTHELNTDETGYVKNNTPQLTGGLDVKYGLSSKLTLDLTVNTDFAQVEADDQKVNLTRFSLFFPEKRLFFQERSSLFSFSLGGPNNVFYSRRIGIDNGEPVQIYGGARLVGRLGKWDMGFLDMQTAPHQDLSSENFGVFRAKRQIINPNSFIGGIFTSRLGTDGTYNNVYGLDGFIRVFGDDYMTIRWAQSFESDSANNPFSMAPTRLRFQWQRRSVKGLGYSFTYSYSGNSYHPGIGFEMRDKYYLLYGQVLYGWLPGEEASLFSHKITLRSMNFFRLDNSLETSNTSLGWNFQAKSFYSGDFSVVYNYESLRDTFRISDDAGVPAGNYNFFNLKGMFSTPMNHLFFILNNFEMGQFYDGSRISFMIAPTWNVSSNLNLSGTYQINRVWFPGRSQNYLAHLAGFKVLYMLNTKLSLNSFIQYNSRSGDVLGNIRFRYNPREGNDLYIVYNDDINSDLTREIPNLPRSNGRTIVLKYTYTFNVQ